MAVIIVIQFYTPLHSIPKGPSHRLSVFLKKNEKIKMTENKLDPQFHLNQAWCNQSWGWGVG